MKPFFSSLLRRLSCCLPVLLATPLTMEAGTNLASVEHARMLPILITNTSVLSDYNGEDVSCAGACDGIALASVVGGVPPYSWLWEDGQTNAVAIGLCPGWNTVEINDATGLCLTLDSVFIGQPAPLTVSASAFAYAGGFNISCHGESDGQASAVATGGTGSTSFLWGDGQMGPNAIDLFAGSIFVQASDANFCTALDTVVLIEPQPIQGGGSVVADVSCRGRSDGSINVVLVGGSGGYTYTWADGPTGPIRTGLMPGTYSLAVSDLVGCTWDTVFTIGNRPVLQARLDDLQLAACQGVADGSVDMLVLGGSPPYDYQWTHGPNTEDLASVAPGDYVFAVTDARGCSVTVPITVSPVSNLTVSALAVGPPCGDASGAIHLTPAGATGTVDYLWDDGQTTASAVGLTAGLHAVVVTDDACTVTQTIELPSSGAPNLTASSTPSNCSIATGTATGSASGGALPYTWLWSDGQSTQTAVGLTPGLTWVQATDANGCVAIANTTVKTTPLDLALSATVTPPSACGRNDASISVVPGAGTGPYMVLWNTGATGTNLTGLGAGTYIGFVSDLAGCRDTMVQTIDDVSLAVSFVNTPAACGAANASSIVTAIGGTPPLQYRWSTGDTTTSINGEAAGNYTVVIRDANQCTYRASTILRASPGVGAFADVQGISCEALDDGAIDIELLRGVPPVTFTWADGPSSEDRTDLIPGTYTVELLDAGSCLAAGPIPLGDGCTQPLDAVDDFASPIEGETTLIFVLNNDSYPDREDIVVSLVIAPVIGTVILNPDGSVSYTAPEGVVEPDSFSYALCNGFGLCDTAWVYLDLLPQFQLPNAFSPNGDGINDFFDIRGIDAFPDNQLIVFNRWGDEVYKASSYSGGWNGSTASGKSLPDGTYYFTLDLGSGLSVLSGYLVLQR